MDIFNFLLSLFLLLLLFPLISAVNNTTPSCPTSICSNSNFTIRFPFQAVPGASPNCVYPGFNLSCDNQGNTVIRFPYSGEFFVRSIDYQAQQIQLYDPSNCLPRRLLDYFNLSGTPFRVAYHINYTFMVCPTAFTQSRFTAVPCLSNSINTTLATSSNTLAEILAPNHCKLLVTMPIPVSSPTQADSGFTSGLNGDLQLYWDVPNCEDCEAQGAMCGFENNTTSQQVICFDSPGTGNYAPLFTFIFCSTIS